MDNDMDPDGCIARLDCGWMTEMNKYNTRQARAILETDTTTLWYKVRNHTPSVMLIIGYAIFIFLVCPAIVIWKDYIEPTRKTKVERMRREQEEEEQKMN